jgi:hypothetical protein
MAEPDPKEPEPSPTVVKSPREIRAIVSAFLDAVYPTDNMSRYHALTYMGVKSGSEGRTFYEIFDRSDETLRIEFAAVLISLIEKDRNIIIPKISFDQFDISIEPDYIKNELVQLI